MFNWNEKVAIGELSKNGNLPIVDLNPTEKRMVSKHRFENGYHLITRTFDLWNLLCAKACIDYYNTLRGLEGKFSIEYTEISDGYFVVTTKMPHLNVPNTDILEKHNMPISAVNNLIENLNRVDKTNIEKFISGILSVNNVHSWKLICLDIGNNNVFVHNNQYYLLDIESFGVICYGKDGKPIKLTESTKRKPRATNCKTFIDTSKETTSGTYFKNVLDFLYSF
jgi:hypothetical protein